MRNIGWKFLVGTCCIVEAVMLLGGSTMVPTVSAEPIPPLSFDWKTWGDQGDGTYRNPVLPSDYSDLDCIRVGDSYYAISSTFQYSPGVVILHSKDLVN
ncbi:MAG TPA: family 43 glycosylhydrolase, partial [Roseimicrobium sp.]|nr:family 43 glycosylhydrolase [Roseimicrobium sp.]